MLHACSWLQFYFKGDGVSGTTTSPWKILSIDILSLSEAETATITGNNIIWSETCTVDAGTKKPYNVYTGTRTDNYSTSQGLELQDCRAGMSGSAVVTAENSVLVIPQTPCDLSVTYQYEIGGNTITEVASASLKYSGTDKWVAGTKYTYYVTIGATPIQIKPVADGWANGSGTLDKVM